MRENNFWDEDCANADRDQVDWAWGERVGNGQREIEKGVRRVDYLRSCCTFEGLTKRKHRMWLKLKGKGERIRTCSTCLFPCSIRWLSCIFMFLFHRRGHCIIDILEY